MELPRSQYKNKLLQTTIHLPKRGIDLFVMSFNEFRVCLQLICSSPCLSYGHHSDDLREVVVLAIFIICWISISSSGYFSISCPKISRSIGPGCANTHSFIEKDPGQVPFISFVFMINLLAC